MNIYEKALEKIEHDKKCKPQATITYNIQTGVTGPTGPTGPAGGVLNYADFYALMPPDNAATVAPGTDVSFPQDGPNSGASITRTGPSLFNLSEIRTYEVYFTIPVS